MYSDLKFPTRKILIVKTSSLGDIIQAFSVLPYLRRKFPQASIDWVVEHRFAAVVSSHPLIAKTISFEIKKIKEEWRSIWQELRRERYGVVFDLQGNCKSAVFTLLSRSDQKVGFGKKSVREWPNLLATHQRYEVSRSLNIRLQYINLIQQYLHEDVPTALEEEDQRGVRFHISRLDQERVQALLLSEINIMVCPGSRWINKQLPVETLILFLKRVEQALHCSFLLIGGSEEEKRMCKEIQSQFPEKSRIIPPLAVPVWQNLMSEVQLLIAMDSSALHLCATTSTPSFSLFGPTAKQIFKPMGSLHAAFQGSCPYGRSFEKQCPLLRSCPTGACIRQIDPEELFECFYAWWVTASSKASKSM